MQPRSRANKPVRPVRTAQRDRQAAAQRSILLTTGEFGPDGAKRLYQLGFTREFVAYIAAQPLVNPWFFPARRVFHGIGIALLFTYLASITIGQALLFERLQPVCGPRTPLSIMLICLAAALIIGSAIGTVLMLKAPAEVHTFVGAAKIRRAANRGSPAALARLGRWVQRHGDRHIPEFLARISQEENKWGDTLALSACGLALALLISLIPFCQA
ncbi:hypothetical protein [Maricaulis sp.]|uniref:hypothetical protein n=1 Tax=Maricaulis sp. TaxID=1486257 RepID=UPI002B274EA7|nr:hypothetical protein [Maricaulis sp.]